MYRVRRWDRALSDLERSQTTQLLEIVRHASGTAFGKRHGFKDVQRYEDWRSKVPVGDYDSFHPYIARMMEGERDLLVPEFVKHFGNSSGSSNRGKQKFLPITERQLRHQRAAAGDTLFRYLVNHGVTDFTSGYTMGLFPPTTMKEQGPVTVTNNPALMFATLPLAARPMYLPNGPAKVESDYDRKLEMIADQYLDHDVRAVSGTTCWFSLLFDKLLDAARRKGRKAEAVRDIWPNLRLLLGGGVSAAPYLPVIEARLGTSDFALIDTYNATEGGIYACTDRPSDRGMVMLPDRGVFFEFVPLEERGKPDPKRVPLWGLELDQLYSIVVTTSSGLYAYELGDIVRFVSTKPVRIEFAGRLAGCLSTTQELTTHVEIESAVRHALNRFAVTPVDFAAGADVGVDGSSKSRYLLFIEPKEPIGDEEGFLRAFDEGLCEANRVYREHRSKDAAILPPKLIVLEPGAVARFMQASGRTSVQTKFPRIVDDDTKALLLSFRAG
ncbi:MAG: GH3 auxin-responsive promoter family protein [Myxococcales bacterium]|nr:GH3 auxin-responsive promoter family protein [Myxococcales bacterium]